MKKKQKNSEGFCEELLEGCTRDPEPSDPPDPDPPPDPERPSQGGGVRG